MFGTQKEIGKKQFLEFNTFTKTFLVLKVGLEMEKRKEKREKERTPEGRRVRRIPIFLRKK